MTDLFKKLKSGKLRENFGKLGSCLRTNSLNKTTEPEIIKEQEQTLPPQPPEDTILENAKFLGSVVAPFSMSSLSKGEINSTIYGAVIKAISHSNRDIELTEHKIQLRAEDDNLIDRVIDSPHIDKTCDVYLTEDGIKIFVNGEDKPVYDHCLTCISSSGTRIPNRDSIFVYCAQLALNVNSTPDMKLPSSYSRQIFVFDLNDQTSTNVSQAYSILDAFFKGPPKYQEFVS